MDWACPLMYVINADINGLLRKVPASRPNHIKEESKALAELKRDKDRIILTAGKGVAVVVSDKKDYIENAQNLLVQPAYRAIETNPTNKLGVKLITMLRKIKRESGLEENLYKSMYLKDCTSPKLYGLPKVHTTGTPLRPIVSSRDSVTYEVAKVLAKILRPLVGKSPNHIQSTKDFVNRVSKVTLLTGECLCSYDVTALFTSVPIDPALNIIRELLEQDNTLWDRTVLSVQNIIELLGFCLHNT